MGAVINYIKLDYLYKGIDATAMINKNLNWFKMDLAA